MLLLTMTIWQIKNLSRASPKARWNTLIPVLAPRSRVPALSLRFHRLLYVARAYGKLNYCSTTRSAMKMLLNFYYFKACYFLEHHSHPGVATWKGMGPEKIQTWNINTGIWFAVFLSILYLHKRCRFPFLPLCSEQEHTDDWKCVMQVRTMIILIS